jgi:O-antigen/teichoic acid export membrane protein
VERVTVEGLPASTDRGLVARNSFYLTAQPLFMNVVSLCAIGYIARTLGVADFGIFNLVFIYTALFFPVAQAGANRTMVRDMALAEDKAGYVARMLPVRVATMGIALVCIILSVGVAGYDRRTTLAIVAGSGVFTAQMLAEVFADVFLGCERTEMSAIVQLVAGLTLTGLSVAVLLAGFGLYAVIAVYALGHLTGIGVASYILQKHFFRLRWTFDLHFARSKIVEGLPFFASTMLWFLTTRIDTLVLSKMASAVELGWYTTAMILVSRLSVLPQGLSTALLPTLSRLDATDRQRGSKLVCELLDKVLVVALVSAAFTTLFARDIVSVLFGRAFAAGAVVLAVGIWAVVLRCVSFVQFSFLTARHQERKVMATYAVSTAYCIVATVALVSRLGMLGAVLAFLSTQGLIVALFAWYSGFTRVFTTGVVVRTAAVMAVMAAVTYGTRTWAPWYSMPAVLVSAVAGLFAFGLVRAEDVRHLTGALLGRIAPWSRTATPGA